MSAATRCDNCGITVPNSDRDELEDWLTVEQGGERSDYCTASCASQGIEKRRAHLAELLLGAMEEPR